MEVKIVVGAMLISVLIAVATLGIGCLQDTREERRQADAEAAEHAAEKKKPSEKQERRPHGYVIKY